MSTGYVLRSMCVRRRQDRLLWIAFGHGNLERLCELPTLLLRFVDQPLLGQRCHTRIDGCCRRCVLRCGSGGGRRRSVGSLLGAILPCRHFGFRTLLLFGGEGCLGFWWSGRVRRRVEDQRDRALRFDSTKKTRQSSSWRPVGPRNVNGILLRLTSFVSWTSIMAPNYGDEQESASKKRTRLVSHMRRTFPSKILSAWYFVRRSSRKS